MKNTFKLAMAGMKSRVTAMHGLTAQPGALADLGAKFDARLVDPSPEQVTALCALMDRARGGDRDAVTELNELRSTTIDLYVRAMSNFASFFAPVSLKANEQACFMSTFRNPVSVKYMGQDGGPRTAKAVKAQRPLFIDMREIHSDEVGYQIRDINLGTDIAAASQATVDIGWDMANKVDLECYNLLTAGKSVNGNSVYGPFVTTGAPLSRTYIPNARINAANLPTTNDLVLTDNTTTTKFRLAVCKAILRYCESWGNIWGGPVRPTGMILVPSSDSVDLADEITPTSLIFPNAVAEGLLQNFSQFSYMGVRWTLVPDVTLAPGVCFPVLNRPVGELYLKPMFDEEFVETDRKKNWETRSQMKVLNLAIPEPWRVFALRLRYRSAAE